MDADLREIKQSLEVLFQPGDTIELRCVGNRTISGFYRDQEKLVTDSYQLNSTFKPLENVYVCLNTVQAEMYGRRADQFAICKKGESVRDKDVACRRWLLIDIDPVRPTGVSATDQQKQSAINLAKQVYAWLQEQLGGNSIVCADSGNGAHMLLRLADLPNDEQTHWTCGQLLQLLASRFNSDEAKVDCTTSNAARICTLYGTVKRKGSDIPAQPHRLSKLLHVPHSLEPVIMEQLMEVTAASRQHSAPLEQPVGNGQGWNVEQLLSKRGIEYTTDRGTSYSGDQWTTYSIDCPFSSEHSDGFVIGQWDNGAVFVKCHHDSCRGLGWPDLKTLWQLPTIGGITVADIVLPSPPAPLVNLAIIPAQTIQPQSVEWLWPDRIALGKMTIIAGYGGSGKTFLLCDLAARSSSGATAPDGRQLRGGRILIATGEDGLADTLVPRLLAHDANLSLIDFIEGVRSGEELELLDLLRHIKMLRSALEERPDTVMLLVDPISSFMGAVDTHKTSDVRRVLSAVAKLAEDNNVAFVGIHHLRKAQGPAIHAITGSQAFSDAVRTVWLIGADRDNPKRRLMLPSKNNLADTFGSGLAYTIEMGRVIWESSPVLLEADDLLSDDSDATPRQEAEEWLRVTLADGPQPAQQLIKAAKADGIAERTLRRAKKQLGVTSTQVERQWHWQLVVTLDSRTPDCH